MKKIRFAEEQMVKILREADKTPVAEVTEEDNTGRSCTESLCAPALAAGESKVEVREGALQQVPQQHC